MSVQLIKAAVQPNNKPTLFNQTEAMPKPINGLAMICHVLLADGNSQRHTKPPTENKPNVTAIAKKNPNIDVAITHFFRCKVTK